MFPQSVPCRRQSHGRRDQREKPSQDDEKVIDEQTARDVRTADDAERDNHTHEHDQNQVDLPYRRLLRGLVAEVIAGQYIRTE